MRVVAGTAHTDLGSRLNPAAGTHRVLTIRAQIERALLQPPTVETVVISADGDSKTALQT